MDQVRIRVRQPTGLVRAKDRIRVRQPKGYGIGLEINLWIPYTKLQQTFRRLQLSHTYEYIQQKG